MRIYVAAKWEDRPRARIIMDRLIAAGHEITYDWTRAEQFSVVQASHDKQGVMTADALVFIAEKDLSYKGAYVEFGMAIAIGLPVYILGHHIDQCIFTKLPQVTYGIENLL